MFISLHIPKTGGLSFKKSLEFAFTNSLFLDYHRSADIQRYLGGDILAENLLHVDSIPKTTKCIHGHFLMFKWAGIYDSPSNVYITWVREPFERLVSEYYFFIKNSRKRVSPFWNNVLESNWSVEQYCLCNELRNTSTKLLLNFPKEKFNFIGVTEHYDTDIEYFSKNYLDISMPVFHVNVTTGKDYDVLNDDSLRKQVNEFHHYDYALYEYALNARENR